MLENIPSPVWLSFSMLVSLVVIGIWGLNYRGNDLGTIYDGSGE